MGIRESRQGIEVFLITDLAFFFFPSELSAIRIVIHCSLIVILAIIILRFQLSRSLIPFKCIACIFQL